MTREDSDNNCRSLAGGSSSSSSSSNVNANLGNLANKGNVANVGNVNMEYGWLEQIHDPITTDTNLAEIDFEDFKNEDLAYAFSCGVSELF
jgi:hypothetical protein